MFPSVLCACNGIVVRRGREYNTSRNSGQHNWWFLSIWAAHDLVAQPGFWLSATRAGDGLQVLLLDKSPEARPRRVTT
jgi:hypothetical protein